MLFRVFTLLAMAALAISTWILSSPARRPSMQDNGNQTDLPGYYLKNAVLTEYDAMGAPNIRIEAERIDQVEHGNEVALYNVKVNYDGPDGQTWVLVGDTAHVLPGGNIVDVSGNVRLQGQSPGTQGGAVLYTDTMRYEVAESLASTKDDVRMEYGGHILTARGLTANLKERTMHLESKVNGRFLP
ncbi:MAG TPA: LPS export ABC transporter periplasmic protein LptC [Steroidobacteraceae bacterium]|jgi:lipopolysaccharide export system protein LptC